MKGLLAFTLLLALVLLMTSCSAIRGSSDVEIEKGVAQESLVEDLSEAELYTLINYHLQMAASSHVTIQSTTHAVQAATYQNELILRELRRN